MLPSLQSAWTCLRGYFVKARLIEVAVPLRAVRWNLGLDIATPRNDFSHLRRDFLGHDFCGSCCVNTRTYCSIMIRP